MGLSVAQAAVASLIAQLNGVEAEALSLMGAISANSTKSTQLSNAKSDCELSLGLQPSKSDYYYNVSVGTDSAGNKYQIDSRFQDYSSIATDKNAYVNLTATKSAQGTTLKKGNALPLLKGGDFVGTTVNPGDTTYDKPECEKDYTGKITRVTVIDPSKYWVETPQCQWKKIDNGNDLEPEYDPDSMYRQATDQDDKSKLLLGKDSNSKATFCANAYYISELAGCSAVRSDGKTCTPNPDGIKEGTQYVYVPNGVNVTGSCEQGIRMNASGEDKINNAFNDDPSLSNLYVLKDGSKNCEKVTSMCQLQELKEQGATFVVKTGDAAANGNYSGTYHDINATGGGTTIGGYDSMSLDDALSNGLSAEQYSELITAAVHAFGATLGYDEAGNTMCDEDYIKTNYNVVNMGDGKYGLVLKNPKDGHSSIYEVDNCGEYQQPVGQISAHNLQFDGNGNLVGFQADNNEPVQLKTERLFDEEGYEKAMKEYNLEKKANDVEAAEFEKQINILNAESADMEARLNELSNLKTVLEGFLEAAKSMAKSDAERLGKAFSG